MQECRHTRITAPIPWPKFRLAPVRSWTHAPRHCVHGIGSSHGREQNETAQTKETAQGDGRSTWDFVVDSVAGLWWRIQRAGAKSSAAVRKHASGQLFSAGAEYWFGWFSADLFSTLYGRRSAMRISGRCC